MYTLSQSLIFLLDCRSAIVISKNHYIECFIYQTKFLESADEKTYNTKQKIMPNFDL